MFDRKMGDGRMDINSLTWQGNSRRMMNAVLNEVPFFFRGSVEKSISNWAAKNQVKIVTEELVFRAVDDIAPAGMAADIKRRLQPLRTK